ncbi:hypothetical protein Vretifemale_20348, partial [Volvox reticuliferus]
QTVCPPAFGYDVYVDMDVPGNDLGGGGPLVFADPRSYCNADAQCSGYVTVTSYVTNPDVFPYIGNSFFKAATSPTSDYQGLCLYVKKPGDQTVCPPVSGYDVYVDTDVPGDDLLGDGPIPFDDPRSFCEDDPDCNGYVQIISHANAANIGSSVLKVATSPKSDVQGFCLYVKVLREF